MEQEKKTVSGDIPPNSPLKYVDSTTSVIFMSSNSWLRTPDKKDIKHHCTIFGDAWEDTKARRFFIRTAPGHTGKYMLVSAVNPKFAVNDIGEGKVGLDNVSDHGKSLVTFPESSKGCFFIQFCHSEKCVKLASAKPKEQATQDDKVDVAELRWRVYPNRTYNYPPNDPRNFISTLPGEKKYAPSGERRHHPNCPKGHKGHHHHCGVDEITYFTIQNDCIPFFHCYGMTAANGNLICGWTYCNQDNFKWYITQVPGQNWFRLHTKLNGDYVARQYPSSDANDSPLVLWNNTQVDDDSCKFVWELLEDGSYYLHWKNYPAMCAQLYGGSTVDGTRITTWELCSQPQLKWYFSPC